MPNARVNARESPAGGKGKASGRSWHDYGPKTGSSARLAIRGVGSMAIGTALYAACRYRIRQMDEDLRLFASCGALCMKFERFKTSMRGLRQSPSPNF